MLIRCFIRSAVLVPVLFLLFLAPVWAESSAISIGTAGVAGVYYPLGGGICRLVNQKRNNHGIRCTVESTGGSVYNLRAVRTGELHLGIVQSDWQHHAYQGTAVFVSDGPDLELRTVFSVHPEPFTLVARADAGIRSFNDLKGKRVDIGFPGSGPRATLEVLMAAKGWQLDDFLLVSELNASDQAKALCDNKVDAMVYTVGHPSPVIKEATTACDSVLVSVMGQEAQQLVAEHPFYRATEVPGGMYRGNEQATPTLGVGAAFVTSARVSEEAVYQVVKSVFENIEYFRSLHPALHSLTRRQMVRDGLAAPLHPGAVRFYREVGLLK